MVVKNAKKTLYTKEELAKALDWPVQDLNAFFIHIENFCLKHGGTRHYAKMLERIKKYRESAHEV